MQSTLHLLAGLLVLTACSSSGKGSAAIDASAIPDGKTDASVDSYDPSAIYDLANILDLDQYEVVTVDDTVLSLSGGRYVRTISYGTLHQGYPLPETQFGISGQLFVESSESGMPLGDTSQVAVALYAGAATAGFTTECALKTGVTCVIAARNVLGPSELSPLYENEFSDPVTPIDDSNLLLFNMLSEMRRGMTAAGEVLTGPLVRRSYVVNIADAAMRLLSATQKVMLNENLATVAPSRFAVTGHSKWAAAAAQVTAVDPRVVGGLAAGWTIDWHRWVELSKNFWDTQLGIDAWKFFCSPDTPCEWTSVVKFANFILSTQAAPDDCKGEPCPGTGEQWLRQIDIRHLIESGALDGKSLALVRNGGESHHVELESRAFDEGARVGQFLFLPESGHVQNTPPHSAIWRHWIRHLLTQLPTPTVSEVTYGTEGGRIAISATVSGVLNITSAELWIRPSYDGTYGALDPIPDYQILCKSNSTCASWQRESLDVDSLNISRTNLNAGYPAGTDIAYVLHVEFDDGSGDLATISTPVQFAQSP